MVRLNMRVLTLALVSVSTALLVSCGSSSTAPSTSNPQPKAVSVAVSPSSAALQSGGSQSAQFMAAVSGTTNTAVTWAVNGVAGGNAVLGTISSGGLYTPPSSAVSQTVTVSATSAADSTKSSSATVILMPPGQVTATQNPQVAQYAFTSPTDATVTVQFGPDTTYGLQTWSQPVPSGGGTLNMLVAGMRANTTYHMRASVQFSSGVQYLDSDHTFTTGGLPASRLPNVTITVPQGPETSPGIELMSLSPSSQLSNNQIEAAASDLQGNIIWYYDFSGIPNVGNDIPFPIKLLPNGHMKLIIGNIIPNFPVSTVREIDLAGNIISELTTADLNSRLKQAGYSLVSSGFHHDFAVLPNGHTVYIVMEQRNIVLPGQTSPTLYTGDSLVDVDPNGNPVWTWSTFDHLDVTDTPFGPLDWTHCNALVYSPTDGDLLLSSRSLSWLMKIDYNNGKGTGNLLWKLGPGGDFSLQNGGPSDWFYNQHYPNFLGPFTAGEYPLAVWDNGDSRPDPATGKECNTPGAAACYSRGLILTVNEPQRTAAIDWQDNLSPLYALCCGDISVLSSGNVDMGAGATSIVNPQSTEALEVTQQAAPQVVWQMNISGQFSYRIVRIPSLYPGVTW